MLPIIKSSELVPLVLTGEIRLIDARIGAGIKESYLEKHLKGALFVDLETDLADIGPDASIGGRHPLPSIERFARLLGSLGIEPETDVVVYDNTNGSNAAARFWWMLRSTGHDKVRVLDGGFDAAIAAGAAVSGGDEVVTAAKPYPVENWKLPVVDISTVENVVNNPDFLVIDVRDAYRYRGEKEPIDLIAGHIPGAVNIPLTSNLDAEGFFLPAETLRDNYIRATSGRDSGHVIVHCGSGVTACHTILAMSQAGMEIPALYVGSWSEWSRTGRPIGKG